MSASNPRDPAELTATLHASSAAGPAKKPYEITYKTKSVEQLQAEQKGKVEQVAGLLDCDVSCGCWPKESSPLINPIRQYSTAATLLRHYRWNSEKLTESFWDDPTRTLAAAGLSPPSSPSTSKQTLPSDDSVTSPLRRGARRLGSYIGGSGSSASRSKKSEAFECPICCIDVAESGPGEPENTLSLGCNHKFCIDCWKEYLERKIMDEAESGRVQCMENGCGRIVGEKIVFKLVTPAAADR